MARILGKETRTIYRRLASDRLFVWLARQVSFAQADEIRALKHPGLGIRQEFKRFYPNRELFAQTLGFTDVDGKGLAGIELSREEQLRGERESALALRDARGRKVLQERLSEGDENRGQPVQLTIDAVLQDLTEQVLGRTVVRVKAKTASAVMLEVGSGEVLALATAPGFNPNTPATTGAGRRRNRPVTDQFEPGSTMKPFVVARALDAGVVDLDSLVFCENGRFEVSGHSISDGRPHGWLSLAGICKVIEHWRCQVGPVPGSRSRARDVGRSTLWTAV